MSTPYRPSEQGGEFAQQLCIGGAITVLRRLHEIGEMSVLHLHRIDPLMACTGFFAAASRRPIAEIDYGTHAPGVRVRSSHGEINVR